MVSTDNMPLMAETFTDRLRKAMRAREMGPVALDAALDKKLGYVSTLLGREGTPKVDSAAAIAKALGVRLDWLATGEGPMESDDLPTSSETRHKTFKDLPGWLDAEATARARYRKIPEVAWLGARMLMAANPPMHIDEAVVLSFAQAWLTSATDDEREAAAMEEGLAAMAAEDEAYRQRLLGLEPPPPPGKAKAKKTTAKPRKRSA